MTTSTGFFHGVGALIAIVGALHVSADTQILLIDGAQAPDGLGPYSVGETSTAAIAGDTVAIAAAVAGAGDVLLVSGCESDFSVIAKTGDALPNTNVIDTLRSLGGPVPNRYGRVAFPVDSSLASNPNASTSDLVLGTAAGTEALVAGHGDDAPDGDGQLSTPLSLTPAINDAGQVAYSGSLFNTSLGSANDEGVFRFDPVSGAVTQIVRKGDSAPRSGTFTGTAFQSNQVFDSPFISADGRVAFKAAISGSVFGDNGLFVGDGAAIQSYFRLDDVLPGPGSPRFGSAAGFDFNASGSMAAVVNFTGTSGSFDAVYRSDGEHVVRIAGSGDTSPSGLPFRTFSTTVKQDANGKAVFAATVTSSSSTPNGIYTGDGTTIRQLAIVSGMSPSQFGAFTFMGPFTISPSGHVAFIAGAGGGVSIFRQFGDGPVEELISSLDMIDGIDITSLTLAGRSAGQGAGINDRGEVLFNFTLADGRGGVGMAGVQPGGGNGLDSDGDGVIDACDNCTAVANANQVDADTDGYGNACDADYNQDCAVNGIDLGAMRAAFFTDNDIVDLNGDGIVNPIDLGTLRSLFFMPPGPGASGICD